jgi:hypothetical protein
VIALFYHIPPTISTPSPVFPGARSPTSLTLAPRGRQGNLQMEFPMLSSIACCEVWRHTPARPDDALPQSRCYMAFQSPACSNA